jgi:hypothetical protein
MITTMTIPQQRLIFSLDKIELGLNGNHLPRVLRRCELIHWEVATPDISYFSFFPTSNKGCHRVLDGRFTIMMMDLVQGNAIEFQTSQAPIEGFDNPLGAAVFTGFTLLIPADAELGGNHNVMPSWAKGSGKNFFRMTESIHIGGIEKVDAQIKRLVNRADRFLVIHPAIAVPPDCPAAEPDSRDFQIADA